MEFPVFVASDVHGEKVNLALRYNPWTDTLDHLLTAASHCFAGVAHLMCQGPLPPFSAAYIYQDVQFQWDALQDRTQLSPCCQVYVFREAFDETVAGIPDPLDSSRLLLMLTGKHASMPSLTDTSVVSQPSPLNLSASNLSIRLASNRWALPQYGQQPGTSRLRFDVSSPLCKNRVPLVRMQSLTSSDKATRTDDNADDFHKLWCTDETVVFRPVQSHRFRLQIFSPTMETEMRHGDTRGSAENPLICSGDFRASGPQTARVKPKRRHSSDSYKGLSAESSYTGEVAIPRSWCDPSKHFFRSTASRVCESDSSFPQSFSVSSYSRGTAQPFPSGSVRSKGLPRIDECHPEVLVKREPRSGGGGSILRDERERIAAQMQMGIDELRLRLREESRDLKRTLSGSRHRVVFPRN
ncbi:hypothetical protein NXY56_005086 [Leishmania guyanensis]|uniref:BILBO1 N-terminal domain-containing protein n=1 Tax=Leishmania guyanensis TaxID=5670 RepID=A0A1E1J213_LEIGU|nr:hypothetical protein, conserved [Leishmania guyanensis]